MSIRFRTMTVADIPGGMRLKNAAGWNQTEADWRRFLDADAEGTFVAEFDGRIVGTVATITYENHVAWIGMMLVDPEFRRRGIGEGLMRRALETLRERQVPVIGLDATPMGQPLYERLGFVATAKLHRWSLERASSETARNVPGETEASPAIDLSALCDRDRAAFGADRSRLIRSFFEEHPERVVSVSSPESSSHAAVIARRGTGSDHLAAWMAETQQQAATVLDTALDRTSHPGVIVDVPAEHPWAGAILTQRGFRIARNLTRMYLGDSGSQVTPADPGHCAILGPEFG